MPKSASDISELVAQAPNIFGLTHLQCLWMEVRENKHTYGVFVFILTSDASDMLIEFLVYSLFISDETSAS